jgi:hypothetical protein
MVDFATALADSVTIGAHSAVNTNFATINIVAGFVENHIAAMFANECGIVTAILAPILPTATNVNAYEVITVAGFAAVSTFSTIFHFHNHIPPFFMFLR